MVGRVEDLPRADDTAKIATTYNIVSPTHYRSYIYISIYARVKQLNVRSPYP